jgi:orotate phosphoribosyltransferase-like protein
MDRLAEGLLTRPQEGESGGSVPWAVLIRNIDWMVKSSAVQAAHASGSLRLPLLTVDLRGNAIWYSGRGTTNFVEVPRDAFRQILNTDPTSIYYSLIYGTNAYIGHYCLKNAHIRTHYDLQDFVKKDAVWEYLYDLLFRRILPTGRNLVLAVGLEQAALLRIGEQLKATLAERVMIDFECIERATSGTRIAKGWATRADVCLVVTDVVNTGTAVRPVVAALKRESEGRRPIHLFAVAKMLNSPTHIEGIPLDAAAEIRRNFYPNRPAECPLCAIGQPRVKVNTLEDFQSIGKGQLTPFDFWEMVTDAKALRREEVDSQGRQFAYRVDTRRLVRQYGAWLGNLVAHRFGDTWPNVRPDVICTVEKEPGMEFSRLVADAIGVRHVVGVPRDVLNRVTPSGGLPPGVPDQLRDMKQALIVDDGVNYGTTLTSLIGCCRATGAPPLGALVLASRLGGHTTNRIRALMARRPLVALYEWPATTHRL